MAARTGKTCVEMVGWILAASLLFGLASGQHYRWHVGEWSECQHERCGPGGSQYRDVWCITQDGRPVTSDRCDEDFKPTVRRSCTKPCSQNVVLHITPTYDRGRPRPADQDYGPETADSSDWEPTEVRGNRFDLGSPDYGREEARTEPRLPLSSATSDVEWVVSQWSSCRLESDTKACGRNSGVRLRNVTCERRDSPVVVSSARCLQVEPMPIVRESCELLCRQDCVVGAYSDWSDCGSSCQLANRTRVREVIVPPRHRGSHCPDLSEMLPCVNCSTTYTYQFSPWLPCSVMDEIYLADLKSHPLIGFQTREVTCLQSKGVLTSDKFCQDKFPNVTPKKSRACVLAQDCVVSQWSSMTPYNSSCIGNDGVVRHGYMVRTRQVLQLPMGSGDPCPSQLVDYIALIKEDAKSLRSCKQAKWITSNWTPCEAVPGYNHCGTGVQMRKAICVEPGDDGAERPVDESHCPFLYEPSVALSCTMECDWDCSVSQWSAWSTCQDSECDSPGLRQRRADENIGKKFRTRVILTLPGSGGKPCPHLSETRMCEPDPCFTWNITLGPCEPTTRGGCGDGTQLRKAVCLNRVGVKVRERFCHETLQTEQNWANCYVPCPEDCIVSEWGTWSTCPSPCDIPFGSRATRTRTRHILSSQMLGRSCPYQSNLRQTEACPVIQDCETYQWEVSAWGPCRLDQQQAQCGTGTQARKVECLTAKKIRAPAHKCLEKIQPSVSQTCLVPCPLDCELTEWSDWSACGSTCLPLQARQIYPSQVRRRYVLQQPLHGGAACPTDMSEEQSCLELPVCQTYFWEVSEWSDCILAPEFPRCGQGLRARNATCKHANNKVINDVAVSVCLENLGFLPDFTEACQIPCESECQFENWTPWTFCDPQCEKRSRFRFRALVGDSKRLKECKDSAMEKQDCICSEQVALSIGGWSDCIVETPPWQESPSYMAGYYGGINHSEMALKGPLTSCGPGKQYMTQTCQNPRPDLFSISRCAEPHERPCEVQCPVDCKTTEWTSWSACSVHCGSGIQQRERHTLGAPSNGGRKCPFMFGNDKQTQTRVCTIECSYKVWKTDDWGPCFPNSSKVCGDGTHARQVRCVSVGVDGSEAAIDSHFCDKKDEPVSIKSCSLPCPGECVLSEWSDWDPRCRQPCNGQQTQIRTRSVLRWPRNYDMMRYCTGQQEERICQSKINCIEYSWDQSDWTSCLVNEGRAECGVGHKERFPICRNQNGEKVENYRCQQTIGPATEPLVVSCEIPCDYDCLLSEWSDWSPCNASCGLGVILRKRTVLQNPIGNGRKCPEKNEQYKSCYNKGCYRWHVSEWSHCNIEMNFCGYGIQERNVSCLGDDGRSVNFSFCEKDLEKLVLQTTRPCNVPCPGECFLSDWSSWSLCFISCEDFSQGFIQGVQARSRAILAHPMPSNTPCNTTLWEDRVCQAPNCTVFRWTVSPWDPTTGLRQVTCQRHDGIQVEGGCDERQRPPGKLACDRPTCLSPAVCIDTDECECPRKDQGILYSVNDTAQSCKMNVTATGGAATGANAEMAKSPNIWMYAVIVVGTVFVIAVTAALYNMCELFRTGPRPRRKGDSREGSTTGTIHSVRSMQGSSKGIAMSRSENSYRQISHVDADEETATLSDKELIPPPSHNSHHGAAPLASPNPEDIPDIVSPSSVMCTSAPVNSSASSKVSTAALLQNKAVLAKTKVSAPMHDRTNPIKINRRYHRLHRFLPDKLSQCFACKDRAGANVVHATNSSLDCTDVTEQTVALTFAHLDAYEDCSANTSSSFQSHNCMLAHTHPSSLQLAKRSQAYAEVSRKTGDITGHSGSATSRTHTIPHAGTREDLRLVTHTSCCSSSESLAMSSDLISGKQQEESSQCSLQLGDTAETLVGQDPVMDPLVYCQVKKASSDPPSTYHPIVQQQRPLNLNSKPKLASFSSKKNPAHGQIHVHSPVQEPNSVLYWKSPSRPRNERTPSGGSSVDELCYCVIDRPVHLIPSLDDLVYSQKSARSPRSYFRKGDNLLSTSISGFLPSETHRQKPNISSGSTSMGKVSRPPRDAHHMTTSPSFSSLPESAVHSAQRSRRNLPLLEKASQDSGHASIPRSRTVSPGEFSLDNSDVLIRTGSSTCIKNYSPLHVQTSLESGHDFPTPGLCHSYRKDISSPGGLGIYLMCSQDSPSQHSNISGMETSV